MQHPETKPPPPTWRPPAEMGKRVRLHPKTLLRLAQAKVIPCLRAGRAIRFDADAVEQALIERAATA